MPLFWSHVLGVLVLSTVRADDPVTDEKFQTTNKSIVEVASYSTTLASGNDSETTPIDHSSPIVTEHVTAAKTPVSPLYDTNNSGGVSHGKQADNNSTVGDKNTTRFLITAINSTVTTATVSSVANTSQSQTWTSSLSAVTTATILNSAPGTTRNEKAGFVILFLILFAILCLGVLLYFLRKKSRKYSFDLQRPGYDHETPLTCMEQPGTFEPTKENPGEFEYASADVVDVNHQGVVTNGSAGSPMTPGGNGSTEETGEKQDDVDGNSFNNLCCSEITLTPPIKRVGFSLDLDLNDRQSDQSDTGED
ncbi:hypothetical protein UPYG_G00244360 [Umbra pygmaea]|uniref:Uncharacterized protein n=1 Tax=Umbra pygmaea TaxID=75934 RepID=A0ABD0WHM1_UMBPY